MPNFRYTALDGQGNEVRGSLDAADPRAAAAALRDRTLFPMQIDALAPGSKTAGLQETVTESSRVRLFAWLLPITSRDLVLFLRQLGLMLRTGLTLLQGLEVCRDQTNKPRLARVIDRVAVDVQAGVSLSDALAAWPRYFPVFVVKLIESAEASGELDTTLERAAVHLERRAELRARLISSLIYPAVVVLTSIAVAAFLVLKVIPQFAKFFQRRGAQLPWATQMLVDISGWLLRYGPYLLTGLLLLAGVLTVAYLTRRGRLAIHRGLLTIPVIGGLLAAGAMAQFSQTLSVLLSSGLPLLASLKITADVIGNLAISGKVRTAADDILRGQDLSRSLRGPVIPGIVTQVVAVGEQTGALHQVLDELGRYYDELLQAKIRRMSALIEPVMILILGGMVGFVYFAFFQAVVQLASN